MPFDPFGDFATRGYLRNVTAEKDLTIVKNLEHRSFRSNVHMALTHLHDAKSIDIQHIRETHRTLFADVYAWAGQLRSENASNLHVTKGPVEFMAAPYVDRGLAYALKLGNDTAVMRERPGEVMGCLAFAHPFLDGNGRTLMVVHAELSRRAGIHIEWHRTTKSEYLQALTKEIDAPGETHLDAYLRPFTKEGGIQLEQDISTLRNLSGLAPDSIREPSRASAHNDTHHLARTTESVTMSEDSYERPSGAMHNRFGSDDPEYVQKNEADLSRSRIVEIENGQGPEPTFDRAHLKALHHHIFQDTYPWAGHMRDERFVEDGHTYNRVDIAKGSTQFLPSTRIDQGLDSALQPLADRKALSAGIESFSVVAGHVLGELNYAHPFREGNGRTQRAFISELGRVNGYEIDFQSITKARMAEVSIESVNDPKSTAMQHLVLDAGDAGRRQALIQVISDFEQRGLEPQELDIRTAHDNERVIGNHLETNGPLATVIDRDNQLVVVASRDMPELSRTGDVDMVAKTSFRDLAREAERAPSQGEALAKRFLELPAHEVSRTPGLEKAGAALDQLGRDLDREFNRNDPDRAKALQAGREIIADDIKNGRDHSPRVSENAIERGVGTDRSHGR